MNSAQLIIQSALADFATAPLAEGAALLLESLGYQSPKTESLPEPTAKGFEAAFGHTLTKSAQSEEWRQVELLFQLTADELSTQGVKLESVDRERFDSFLFFTVDLKKESYSRSTLAAIAREINKPFPMPVIVLLRHGQNMTLAAVHRRESKTQSNRDVLERVTLLKDIRLEKPHRAHLDILARLREAGSKANSWSGFLAEWNKVLDVSELNNNFFRDYKTVFELVESSVVLPKEHEDKRRDWTQRLFNRLLFLRFLEKKGWLEFDGDDNYLRTLFEQAKAKKESFLQDRLYYTFFWGLNFPGDNAALEYSEQQLQPVRGIVPFLNGGLFDLEDALDVKDVVKLQNENRVFESILGLFEKYYFTVDETTPLEEEVGIDPEMLGKVFEELVTGRHESGSYYTPRGIVAFMAREALKGYLEKWEKPDVVAKFVDGGDATTLSDAEGVLGVLRDVKICDPACGSGAYLLGMMQELLRLREALFAAKARDHKSIFKRKLEIIEGNLYGADKDRFAVNIAMLRLWLSLVLEFEGENPPPLPNLKYKVGEGDSLAAPLAGASQLVMHENALHEFVGKKAKYLSAHGEEKKLLQSEIEELQNDIRLWTHQGEDIEGFDWIVEFAEVFAPQDEPATVFGTLNLGVQLPSTPAPGGFDIVLANPPYVRQELIKDQKPQLKKIFGENYSGTADLYVYFYLRAHELLKPGGMLAFISPNKWFRAAYGAKLRKYLATHAEVRSITDFGELPVFQAAATFPMVFIAQRTASVGDRPKHQTQFAQIKSLQPPYPDVRALMDEYSAPLPEDALDGENWNLSDAATSTRLATMRKAGTPLGEYVKGQIYRGVLTGFNEAFVIDGATRAKLIAADAKSKELIKPMAKGDDVRRWRIEEKDRWLIVTKIGVEIKKYPAIFKHLKQWQPQLEKRQDQGNHWWELRACAFYHVFEKQRIVYPQIMMEPRFSFGKAGWFTNQKAFQIDIHDLYVLGLLNSSSVWHYLKSISVSFGNPEERGRLEPRKVDIESIPIPTPSPSDRAAIEALVEACLQNRGADCAGEEAEINARVAKLYGLE